MAGIVHLISSHKRIPTALMNDLLGSALDGVKSSHDPIFVMKDGAVVGFVSVSYALYKKRYPLSTKIHSVMKSTPKITPSTDIYTVAKRILSSGVYILPVVRGKKIAGVISARKILRDILQDDITLNLLSNKIEIDPPLIFDRDAKVRDIYANFKQGKTSRVLITGSDGKLMGIATRHDIQDGVWPSTEKLRFGKNPSRNARSIAFDEERIERLDNPIHEFMKTDVVTTEGEGSFREILSRMLDGGVNSIVVVDRNNRPKGIITMRNVLKAISSLKPQETVPIELSDKHQILTERDKKFITGELERFAQKLQKQDKVKHIESAVSVYRNINRKITGFEIHLRIHMMNGEGAMTQVEGKKLSNTLHDAIRKVGQQLKKD